jgi:rubrerythrin|tara:strand:+ start:69 stop:326 length:258 start_codon:yes stop_codon:yes gene_type:complete
MAENKEEVKKITEEELTTVKEHQSKLQRVLMDLGSLEAQKVQVTEAYKEFQEALEGTKKELEEKYGQVNIDLTDGSYKEIETKSK